MSEQWDAVIVGSGAGGGTVAHTLSAAGANVLVLDKGPRYRSTDFEHDEITSCRRDFFIPYPENDPHTLRRTPDGTASPTNAGWTSQCVGGGTVHMSGFFFRFHPEDFRLVSTFGSIAGSTVSDWPLTYEDLAPYYDRVESVVGVSGDTRANPFEPPRAGPYPLPPVVTHPVAGWIDRAARNVGLHPYAVPRAIITRPREDRGGCVYCPLCGSYGCEVDAKSSTAAALLPTAEATGRCEVRPECMVTQVLMRRDGLAKGVVYTDRHGASHAIDADIVVVAASALESARLLLLSTSSRHPNGVGNNGGQVGRNLCFSTLGRLTGELRYEGRSAEEQRDLHDRAPFVGRAVQDFYRVEPAGDLFGKGGTFHLLWAHPNPINAAEQLLLDSDGPVYGEPLTRRLIHHFRAQRTMEVECFGEWLPTEGCHVTLDPSVNDRWGLPAARITIARHPSDLAASQLLVAEATRLMNAIGAEDIRILNVGGETLVLQHGTCRMGDDPATSVTTADGHLHEVPNLYVTCGGSLPTSGAVPSTMTIMANAFRIADRIVQRSRYGT